MRTDRAAERPKPVEGKDIAHVGTIRAAMLALGLRPPAEADVAHAQIIELQWPVGGISGDGQV